MPAVPRPYRHFLPLLLLAATLGLAGCDGPGLDTALPRPTAPDSGFSGEAVVRQADLAGAARPADGAGEAPDTRIEERRGYRLQFDEADALVAAYRETQEACVASAHCQVEQGRLQTPRHGLASGYLALRVARDQVERAEPVRLVAESAAPPPMHDRPFCVFRRPSRSSRG